jgi:hypothetical protein
VSPQATSPIPQKTFQQKTIGSGLQAPANSFFAYFSNLFQKKSLSLPKEKKYAQIFQYLGT